MWIFSELLSLEERHITLLLKGSACDSSVQVCFKCQRFLMKGIEIQIKAIKP